jgi:hypothetical protein
LDDRIPADCVGMAARLHAGHSRMAPLGFRAEAQDRRGGWRIVNPHARSDGCPSK